MIRWDVSKDTFQRGQWFHGKVYAERCDISPSGDKFVYFAGQHTDRNRREGYAGTWTAISRPPYFTAVTLWPLGDTWGGGGIFLDDVSVQIAHGSSVTHPKHPAGNLKVSMRSTGEVERWERQGWTMIECDHQKNPLRWRKPNRSGRWDLVAQHPTWDLRLQPREFSVNGGDGNTPHVFQGDWADWDHHDRLIVAKGGQLLHLRFQNTEEPTWEVLADFTADTFQSVAPPDWAQS